MVVVAIVDDDASILDALALLIESQGWDAKVFRTGEAFLNAHHGGETVDCLILDPHLDGIFGDEVARQLLSAQIPIIGLTARPESPVARRMDMLGAHTILTKPASPTDLIYWITKTTGS